MTNTMVHFPRYAGVRRRRLATAGVLVLLAGGLACEDALAPDPTMRVSVNNYLATEVTVTAGGTTYVPLAAGESASYDVPATATVLTWDPASSRYTDGSEIPGELHNVLVKLHGADTTVDVLNVVGDQIYFMPVFTNSTGGTIDVGIYDGTQTHCLGWLSAATNVYYGFYLLRPGTQVRYFAGHSDCTGTYRYWDRTAVLTRIDNGSGLAFFDANVAP